jgi:phage FluMu protein gp41
MKRIQIQDGLKIGARLYRVVYLRPLNVGDLLAVEEVGGGPYRQAIETLSRQIHHLESEDGHTVDGPIALAMMKQLSTRDIGPLSAASEDVERGEPEAVPEAGAGGGLSDSPAHRVVLK